MKFWSRLGIACLMIALLAVPLGLFLAFLAFIYLPTELFALVVIVVVIKVRERSWGDDLIVAVTLGALYPLYIPAAAIFLAARELFWGEDKEEDLTTMKAFKMFQLLGQYFIRIL